jgi:hypothetical protein
MNGIPYGISGKMIASTSMKSICDDKLTVPEAGSIRVYTLGRFAYLNVPDYSFF